VTKKTSPQQKTVKRALNWKKNIESQLQPEVRRREVQSDTKVKVAREAGLKTKGESVHLGAKDSRWEARRTSGREKLSSPQGQKGGRKILTLGERRRKLR